MSLSGLREREIDNIVANKGVRSMKPPDHIQAKLDAKDENIPGFSLPPCTAVSLNNLTNYLQCDSSGPVPTTPEEQQQLNDFKANGAPTRLENNFVNRDRRHGWWKINEIEELNEVIQCLNPRGIQERD